MESLGNRSPILGLRYSTDALLNQNWDTLDHTISNAFQPESPIQFPESFYVPENSVTKQAVYPGESIYAHSTAFFATVGLCLLANPYRAFEPTPMNSVGGRGGYWFSFGCCAFTVTNMTASPQACDLSVTLYAYGGSLTLMQACPMLVPANGKLPLIVPLSGYGGAPFPPPTNDYHVWVEVVKTTGADATIQLRVESGAFHMVEMP